MANWLEEAEQRQQRHHGSESISQKIIEKKAGIKENYTQNHQVYDKFITRLNNLVQRVNNLSGEERKAFGKIKSVNKKTRLDNHLNIFSSSQRENKTRFWFLFPSFKKEHYKNIHVLYFCVSKSLGMVDVEIRETQLIRTRLKEKIKPEKIIVSDKNQQNIHRHHHQHHQIEPVTDGNESRFHVLYHFEMDKLTDKVAMEIIEWLAFKKEITEISIYESVDDDQKIFLGRES